MCFPCASRVRARNNTSKADSTAMRSIRSASFMSFPDVQTISLAGPGACLSLARYAPDDRVRMGAAASADFEFHVFACSASSLLGTCENCRLQPDERSYRARPGAPGASKSLCFGELTADLRADLP